MAGKARGPYSDIGRELLSRPHAFSFYQIIRLLRLLGSDGEKSEPSRAKKTAAISVRPELSLAFPSADVSGIEPVEDENGGFRVTATFLGLYGTSSPLPTFYTEDLLEEKAEDEKVTRDFMDMLNGHLFQLLFRCWTKYRLYLEVIEEENPKHTSRLFCLLGLGDERLREEIPESYRFLRYLGLVIQHPRSALGLETVLGDALGGMPINLIPCVPRMAKVPEDQRCFLGSTGSGLGKNTFVGEELLDRTGKFRLRIGPVCGDEFRELLPGSANHRLLVSLTDFYLATPLEYDLEIVIKRGETATACLGGPQWAHLGWDTWVFSGSFSKEARAIF